MGPNGYRYLGMGTELAAAVAGGALLGWWIGSRWGRPTVGVTAGAIVGLVGGMANFIRQALTAVRSLDEEARSDNDGS